MKFFLYLTIIFINITYTKKNSKLTSKNTQDEDNNSCSIKYEIFYGNNFDFSGYRSFLPTKLYNNQSEIELANSILELLRSKGIEVDDLKILKKDKEVIIQIYFSKKKNFINNIVLEKEIEDLYNQFQEQKENKTNNLYSRTLIPKANQEAIKELINFLIPKYTGRKDGFIISEKKFNNTLFIKNYHKDIYNLPKKIQDIKFFFVRNIDEKITYSHKIPKGINLSKLKQTLKIDSINLLYNLLNLFFPFPISNIMERDAQELQKYLKDEGYNMGDLLDIKYIEYDNSYIAYIYIFLGEKLNVKNVSFSFENNNNQQLLKELQKIQKSLSKEKHILKNNYIPDYLESIVKKHIKYPFTIVKTINEISYPTKGYNVNFHIKIALDNFYIENIYFKGVKENNLYKKINSKIGYNFSQKTLDEDVDYLREFLNDKVEVTIENGTNDNLKIIVFNIGEPFDFNKIFQKLMPKFNWNFHEGFNIGKDFDFLLKLGKSKLPLLISFAIAKKNLLYSLDSKININLKNFILDLLNKKYDTGSYFGFITGTSLFFKDWSLGRHFVGFNLGSHNFNKYNEDRVNNKFYYKIDLDIKYGYDKNKENPLSNDKSDKKHKKDNESDDNFYDNDFTHQGFSFQQKFFIGKESLFFLKDNGEIGFIINDKISFDKKIICQPYINMNANYAVIFMKKLFIQLNFTGLWSDTKNIPYNENNLNIIGKKSFSLEELKKDRGAKFHHGWHFLSFFLWKINKLNLFIGQSIEIFLGIYWHFFNYNKSILQKDNNGNTYYTHNNYYWIYRDIKYYGGLMLNIKVGTFNINFYLPLSWMISDIQTDKIRFLDFSMEITPMEVKNKYNILIYKNRMPLDKNMLQ